MGNGLGIHHRPIRQRVDDPQNSHIHSGLRPFFVARDTERDQRLKLLFRTNLIEHRLQGHPELLASDGSYQALHYDPNDIRVRHGRRLSRAYDVFAFFAIFLLFGLSGSAGAATVPVVAPSADADPHAQE